jgi:DNA-binding transcriptional LysR family regulator
MDVRQLRQFVAVAEEGSVNKAAGRLGIAQPPLSQQLKRLERELGVTLFHRSARGMELTAPGEGLLTEAYRVLSAMDRLVPKVRAAARGETGRLSLGCVPVGFGGFLSAYLRLFRVKYPKVQLEVQDLHSRQQYAAMKAGTIDVGIVRYINAKSEFDTHPVYNERLVLALPDNHPMRNAQEIRIQDLSTEPFITYGRHLGAIFFDSVIRLCQDRGNFSPIIRYQTENVLTMLGMISAGLGISLVTELHQQLEVPGVIYREVPDLKARLPLILLWDSRRDTPAIRNFRDIILAGPDLPALNS